MATEIQTIKASQLTELTETENEDEFKNYLRGHKDFAGLVDKYPTEQALDVNLAESYDLLARIAPKDLKPTFDLMLDQWDIKNIKSVLIAKEAKLNEEETNEFIESIQNAKKNLKYCSQ